MMGYKVVVCTESVIYHEGAKTLSFQSSLKTYLNHRNSLIIFFTNHTFIMVLALFIPKIMLHFISTLYDLLQLRIKHASSQIKAFFWILKNIKYIITKRKSNNKLRIANYRLKGMFKTSIVVNYFIFRKRYFSNY